MRRLLRALQPLAVLSVLAAGASAQDDLFDDELDALLGGGTTASGGESSNDALHFVHFVLGNFVILGMFKAH